MNSDIGTAPAWQPAQAPTRGERDDANLKAFFAYILTPGFSLAFHAATLHRSIPTISNFRARARKAAIADPTIMDLVRANVRQFGREQGLAIAQARDKAQMPFWCRQSLREYSKRAASVADLAKAFRCSKSTVNNILAGKGWAYQPLTGVRRLTGAQQAPAGRWSRSHSCRSFSNSANRLMSEQVEFPVL